MIRLTDLKLPLNHPPEALRAAVLARLGVEPEALTVFRRAADARRRGAIRLIYTLDVEVADEAAVLRRFVGDPHVGLTPDMLYRLPVRAPAGDWPRPLVI